LEEQERENEPQQLTQTVNDDEYSTDLRSGIYGLIHNSFVIATINSRLIKKQSKYSIKLFQN